MSARATLFAALLALAAPGAARADAGSDSLLQRYLGGLADSTDAWFGVSAAPPDTTGLDSVLHARLRSGTPPPRLSLRPSVAPWLGFNRVDGGVMGASLALGSRDWTGRLSGRAAWGNGPDLVLGEAAYEKTFPGWPGSWTLGFEAGRMTHGMDRDFGELGLAQVRAFLTGSDTRRYYRREGVRARIGFSHDQGWAGMIVRNHLESPLPVTATWNLLDRTPRLTDNLPARRLRIRELEWSALRQFGKWPLWGEVQLAVSDEVLGSGADYQRYRVVGAAQLPLGRHVAAVPQLVWGRLNGAPLPQASFYLGGSRTLRQLSGYSLGGTRLALARLDLIALPDLLALARIPHPGLLPLQGAVFAAGGAVWGRDPYGVREEVDEDRLWPRDHGAWRSEVGVSLLYRPGVPEPNASLRFSYAWPVGPVRDAGGRLSITYARPMDLIRRRD